MIKAYVYMHIGGRTFSVSFLFCSVHMEVRSTICKWTVVMKNLKRSGSVLECLTRDPGIRVWAALAQLRSVRYVLEQNTSLLLSTSLTQKDPSRNNWKIVEWYVKYQFKAKVNMRGSRNSRQGWSRSNWHIKSYDNGFFSHQLILQKTNGYFHRKLSFTEVPEGIQHFSGGGGQLFPGGGPIAYPL